MLDIDNGNSSTIPARTPKKKMSGYLSALARFPPAARYRPHRMAAQTTSAGDPAERPTRLSRNPESRIVAGCAEADGERNDRNGGRDNSYARQSEAPGGRRIVSTRRARDVCGGGRRGDA